MIDIPVNLPPSRAAPTSVVDSCVKKSSIHYKLNPLVLKAILKVEGGKIGTVSKNTNGSYDLGLMQINTIHLPDIKKRFKGVDWRRLT